MRNKRLLQDIGLNAYEAAAYLSLLKYGVSEANILCRDAEVPYGKIYTVLEALAGKGFVEIQASRPKKFRAVNPALALDSFFNKRKIEFEREIEILKGSIEEAKQSLGSVPTQKLKDEVFWTTAITESEIEKFVLSIYGEVRRSVRVIPPALGLPIVSNLLPEILKALDRGVKVRLLIAPRYVSLAPLFLSQSEEALHKIIKGMEIRVVQNCASCFGVVDDSAVVLFQLHPRDKDRILSVVKIWDAGLAKNLGEEFDSLWNWGEQLDLEKFKEEKAFRGSGMGK
ncbi:MAG: HTH-type transcriptional regulator, sugar sensing transcriptional regulator [Euryarchaeota archaeon]|nr:HTH-type transcriptional regulator, sugar sensing transcriptional regulator [Euryarchaeota archaeon]